MANKQNDIFKKRDCLSEQELLAYHNKMLSGEAQNAIERHLLDCPLCENAVEGVGKVNGVLHLPDVTAVARSKTKSLVYWLSAVAAVFIGLLIVFSGPQKLDKNLALAPKKEVVEKDSKSFEQGDVLQKELSNKLPEKSNLSDSLKADLLKERKANVKSLDLQKPVVSNFSAPSDDNVSSSSSYQNLNGKLSVDYKDSIATPDFEETIVAVKSSEAEKNDLYTAATKNSQQADGVVVDAANYLENKRAKEKEERAQKRKEKEVAKDASEKTKKEVIKMNKKAEFAEVEREVSEPQLEIVAEENEDSTLLSIQDGGSVEEMDLDKDALNNASNEVEVKQEEVLVDQTSGEVIELNMEDSEDLASAPQEDPRALSGVAVAVSDDVQKDSTFVLAQKAYESKAYANSIELIQTISSTHQDYIDAQVLWAKCLIAQSKNLEAKVKLEEVLGLTSITVGQKSEAEQLLKSLE